MCIRAAITIVMLLGSVTFAQYWPGSSSPDPMQQVEAMIRQGEAELQQINQKFIDLYRQTTSDYVSPDSLALERGLHIHCQSYPLDCQLAHEGSQRAMQDQNASFAAHQAMMQDRYTANDASFNAWMQQQESQHAAGQAFIQGVIYEESNYTNPASGTAYSLPFAPSASGLYQTSDGYPLVFDAAGNTWYRLDGNGGYTPYYGQ